MTINRSDDNVTEPNPGVGGSHGDATGNVVAAASPEQVSAELGALDEDARLERIHALVRTLAGSDELQRQRYRDRIVKAGLISAGDWRSMMADAKKQAEAQRRSAPRIARECPYQGIDGYTYVSDGDGGVAQLAHFVPKVIAETTRDDGAEVTRHLKVQLTTPNGRVVVAEVPADRLSRAREWAMQAIGPGAVINPMSRDEVHVATAAQYFGQGEWESTTEYAHTGWRNDLGGGWRFLTTSGAIGADGLDPTVLVDLGNERLNGYCLPDPTKADAEGLAEAVRKSLEVLDVGPDSTTVLMLAAAYRAPLPLQPETSVFISGASGSLKSAITALAVQHFGSAFDYRALPTEWKSSANSLEAIAHQLPDVLLHVDDYAPQSVEDPRKLAASADRLFRGSANASGRNRMRPDGTLRPVRYPRAQLLSTGEDVPPGESLRARLTIATLKPGTVSLPRLTVAQAEGSNGTYALAMAGYVQWLAARRDENPDMVDQLKADIAKRRTELTTGQGHMRAPEAAAGLLVGWRKWLEYATSIGAITARQAGVFQRRVKAAVIAAVTSQAEHTMQMRVEQIYLSALGTALAAGKAHLADRKTLQEPSGKVGPQHWGWIPANDPQMAWRSQGDRIGYVDGETGAVYLHPQSAYETAVAHAKRAQLALNAGKAAVHQHLEQSGCLESVDSKDGETVQLTVARRIGGKVQRVLHLRAALLTGEQEDASDGGED